MKKYILAIIAAGLVASFVSDAQAGIFRRAARRVKSAVCRNCG
jgi:hypothetical protein